MEGIEATIERLEAENQQLREALANQKQGQFSGLFQFYCLVHAQPGNVVFVFPIPTSLPGKAGLAELLRRAADEVIKSIK